MGGTRTRTGLKIHAKLDTSYYETGVKAPKRESEEIRLRRHKVFPRWNYTVSPHRIS
jgi:hypothetical protein